MRKEYESNNKRPHFRRKSRLALMLVIIPIFGIMGCIVGFLVTGALTHGLFVQWHSLGTPPEKAYRIVAADFGTVYVVSDKGSLFKFEVQNDIWSGQPPNGSWAPATDSQIDEYSRCKYIAPYAPPTPTKTIDYIQFGFCPEPLIDVRYAVLSDGSVLRLSTPNGLSVLSNAVPIGIIVGVVVGLVLTISAWRKTKSTPSVEEEPAT